MNEMLIDRANYREKILKYKDKDFVKVLTGVRRSGKTLVMELLRNGINNSNIIDINFEDSKYFNITNYRELSSMIEGMIEPSKKNYIFLDEIQEVEGWEKSVNSLRLKNTDIYITGSNSKILNSEYTTILGGRVKSFEILPLSFKEFLYFRQFINGEDNKNLSVELDRYIRIGGFPALTRYNFSELDAIETLKDIYSSALKRDVINRNTIKNIQLLDKIIHFIYDNLGNLISIKSISDYFKSQNRKSADPETIANYIKYLEGGYLLRRCSRYDIKGRRLLETNDKYYLTDHAMQYILGGFKQDNIQGILENIVYMELIRRDYTVYVGKYNDKEIDFVAEKNNQKVYIQVCYSLTNEDVIKREYGTLKKIKDSYPKYVIVLKDDNLIENDGGIKGVILLDFLLKDFI